MAARSGIIELSYARSAGTGDAVVAGCVTSRRDRGKQQQQKLMRQKKEEEERTEKQRQQLAAKILKRHWEEEDRKDRKNRRRDEDEASSDERISEPQRRLPEAQPEAQARQEPEREERGGWVTKEAVPASLCDPQDADVERHQLEQVLASRDEDPRKTMRGAADPEAPVPKKVESAQPSPRGAQLRAQNSAVASQAAGPGRPSTSMARSQVQPAVKKKVLTRGQKELCKAFSLDDDEEASAQRELELASQSKRLMTQKRSAEVIALAADKRHGVPGYSPQPYAQAEVVRPAPSSANAFEQLKKLADWKRACKGARRPMPMDMMNELAAVAECQGTQVTR